MKKILVVGSKNTYRSIIIGAFLKKFISDNEISGIKVNSAGIMAISDIPADSDAIQELAALGVTGDFKAAILTKQAVLEADLILTMSDKIRSAIVLKFPEVSGKIFNFINYFSGVKSDVTAEIGLGKNIAKLISSNSNKILLLECKELK